MINSRFYMAIDMIAQKDATVAVYCKMIKETNDFNELNMILIRLVEELVSDKKHLKDQVVNLINRTTQEKYIVVSQSQYDEMISKVKSSSHRDCLGQD